MLKEVIFLFLKLGLTAFGGPAAHISMMEDEIVGKRQWMSREHFLDMIGATNLIPGPNSTEMAIHCAYHRAGWPGLILGGASFILPATILTGVLAWFYATYQSIPQFEAFFYGIKPAVIVVILGAVYKLGQKALKGWQLGVIGVAVVVMSLLGIPQIVALLIGGVAGTLWVYALQKRNVLPAIGPLFFLPSASAAFKVLAGGLTAAANVSFLQLFWVFFKVGAVLFGSGYVLVAYLEGELVERLGWISQDVLLDAIAMGQFTPGPVLSTATFVGYQIGGFWGAIAATLGIFLPSFVFVAILNPIIPKLRQYPLTALFLNAVNVSALGLMVAVVIKLGFTVLVDWKAWLIMLISLIIVFRFKNVNSAWLVIGGAVLGYLLLMVEPLLPAF